MFPYFSLGKFISNVNWKFRAKDEIIPCLVIVPSSWKYHEDHLTRIQRRPVFCISSNQHANTLFRPRILSEAADLSLAKEWIKYCVHNHGDCEEPSVQIDGLHVIDCESQEQTAIVAPPGEHYAALSYVWLQILRKLRSPRR